MRSSSALITDLSLLAISLASFQVGANDLVHQRELISGKTFMALSGSRGSILLPPKKLHTSKRNMRIVKSSGQQRLVVIEAGEGAQLTQVDGTAAGYLSATGQRKDKWAIFTCIGTLFDEEIDRVVAFQIINDGVPFSPKYRVIAETSAADPVAGYGFGK